MSNTSLATGHEGTIRDQVKAYFHRVRSGEMGALPAVSALILLAVLFSSLSPFFLTKLNFANLFVQSAELAVLACALVFVLLLGEIDLAAGVTAGVGMALFVVLNQKLGLDPLLSIIAALAFGSLTGWVIGLFVARIRVPSFVVTLGFFLGFQGLQLIMLGDGGIYRVDIPAIQAIMNSNMPEWAGWALLVIMVVVSLLIGLWDRSRRTRVGLATRPISMLYIRLAFMAVLGGVAIAILNQNRSVSIKAIVGVPIVIPIVIVIVFIGTFVLDRTLFGRYLYAVGGNPEAGRRAGIDVAKIRIAAFMICSTLAVVSGLLHASRIGSVESTAGRTIVLNGVAAAVVGGVGALVISIIDNGLGLIGLPAGINFLVTGAVLVAAATIDALSRKRSGGSILRT
jgi:D-xylose transport system permease protein